MKKIISVLFMLAIAWAGMLAHAGEASPVPHHEIVNFDQFDLSDEAKGLLNRNGFVITPGKGEADISDVYIECYKKGEPIFVTTDSILHVSHILFDYNLRIAEIYKFVEELDNLSEAMLDISSDQHREALDKAVKEAARRNLAFFSVAKKLLDPEYETPEVVSSLVDEELSLISAHKGIVLSPIMGASPLRGAGVTGEDYSQYVPRGHYTRNELFERFFKAMMWYGRMAFALPDREDTRQALLIVSALSEEDGKWMKIWERIYEPTVFFVGKTDDLDIYDYRELAKEVYGEEISFDEIADTGKLDDFIMKASEIEKTKIAECYVDGMRFMGQRFIPDSYIFDRLTGYPWRFFPKGLDAMAILGSDKARSLLEQQGDFDIPEYKRNFAELEQEFGTVTSSAAGWVDWTQNLYWGWLYCLKPLFVEKDASYPKFMQSDAWIGKELATALASWAELRHDTILYAKQSYTRKCIHQFSESFYVEPYPEVYGRVADLARQMREGLDSRGLLIEECRKKLLKFEDLLKTLERISEKEIEGEDVSGDEYHAILRIGYMLKEITEFSEKVRESVASATDNRMAVIADVHTDANSSSVLEEGVGNPYYIYVVVESDGVRQLTKGAVFSYYEFTWPMEDRLTDEKWQEMLKSGEQPEMPEWVAEFISDTGIGQGIISE